MRGFPTPLPTTAATGPAGRLPGGFDSIRRTSRASRDRVHTRLPAGRSEPSAPRRKLRGADWASRRRPARSERREAGVRAVECRAGREEPSWNDAHDGGCERLVRARSRRTVLPGRSGGSAGWQDHERRAETVSRGLSVRARPRAASAGRGPPRPSPNGRRGRPPPLSSLPCVLPWQAMKAVAARGGKSIPAGGGFPAARRRPGRPMRPRRGA